MEKPLRVRLHIISPVHIGCDDVYEPTSFVIDEKKEKLIEFEPMDYIKSLSPKDRDEFSRICMEGSISSIIKLYKFISNRPVKGKEVAIASGLKSHFKQVQELSSNDERRIKTELNQFQIRKTAYSSHKNLPYIPGSSLKGSLRTAYLSILARDQGIVKRWTRHLQESEMKPDSRIYDSIGRKRIAKKLENDLLGGDFETDPFRMVRVSDLIPVGEVKTKIVYAINKKKKLSKFTANGPFQILETIANGSVFEGLINIEIPGPGSQINRPIEDNKLRAALKEFYLSVAKEELNVIKEIGAVQVLHKAIKEKFGKLNRSLLLIRLGRHSGAEAVTIEGNRFIKIMQGSGKQPKFLDQATTIWLASETSKPATNAGLVPFGWAVLEVL